MEGTGINPHDYRIMIEVLALVFVPFGDFKQTMSVVLKSGTGAAEERTSGGCRGLVGRVSRVGSRGFVAGLQALPTR